jgi:hypothetical protein
VVDPLYLYTKARKVTAVALLADIHILKSKRPAGTEIASGSNTSVTKPTIAE